MSTAGLEGAPDTRDAGRETLTFLLTDVEGSTALWSRDAEAMSAALALHDRLARQAVAANGGRLVKARGEGDSTFSVFPHASDAARAAVAIQSLLAGADWPAGAALSVRAALHTGEVQRRDGDYYGTTVNRCARLRAIAHGGQTVCSRATAELIADRLSGQVSLRPLGSHRLKDLERPEDVYQLSEVGQERSFPPLTSLDSPRDNLPEQLDSFVGREADLAELGTQLKEARLVTIVGTGGVGKTRLALQAAAGLVDHFPGGAWLTELAPLSDDSLVEGALAAALGVRADPLRSLTDALVERLDAEPTLVILDNCEHVAEGAGTLIDGLLRRCRGLSVLATSIEPLRLKGELLHHLGPLSIEDDANGAAVAAGPAVRLFVERAGTIDPAFSMDPETRDVLVRICERLDGIPLAIELAAARTATLGPEELEARLDDRFSLLTSGSRVAEARHRTLRAVVDWSVELLNPQERQVLGRLAVFRDGATLPAVEEVVGGEVMTSAGIVDALSGLVDRSLIFVRGERRTRRYHLLETIRVYSEDRLAEDGVLEAARDRHLSWASQLASGFSANEGADQVEWLARMRAELANLRAALEWSASSPERARRGLHTANNLFTLWMASGLRQEGVGWIERLVCVAQAEATEKVGALLSAGFMASLYWPPAVDSLAEVADGLAGSNHLCQGMAQLIRVCRAVAGGDNNAAREGLDRAMALAPQLARHTQMGALIHSVSASLLADQDTQGAVQELETSRDTLEARGDRHLAGAAWQEQALLHLRMQDEARARAASEEALVTAAEVGCMACRSSALAARSVLASRPLDQRCSDAAEALRLSEEVNDTTNRIEALMALLVLAGDRGQNEVVARLAGGLHAVRTASEIWRDSPGLNDRAAMAVARSQDVLGTAAFEHARAEGAGLTYPTLVQTALLVTEESQ